MEGAGSLSDSRALPPRSLPGSPSPPSTRARRAALGPGREGARACPLTASESVTSGGGGLPQGGGGGGCGCPAVAEPLQEAGRCSHDDAATSPRTRSLELSFTLIALKSS